MHYWDIYTFFNQYFYCFLRIIFRFFYLHKTYFCCKDIYTFFNQCFYHFRCIIFRFFFSTMIGCLFSQANLLFLCVFNNILSVFCLFFTDFSNYNSSSDSVFVHAHIIIDKDTDCLQSNNNSSWNDLWLLFQIQKSLV